MAVASAGRVEEGLALIDAIEGLERYHLLHSARADLLRRLGREADASAAYREALALVSNPAEQAFLRGRLEDLRRREPSS